MTKLRYASLIVIVIALLLAFYYLLADQQGATDNAVVAVDRKHNATMDNASSKGIKESQDKLPIATESRPAVPTKQAITYQSENKSDKVYQKTPTVAKNCKSVREFANADQGGPISDWLQQSGAVHHYLGEPPAMLRYSNQLLADLVSQNNIEAMHSYALKLLLEHVAYVTNQDIYSQKADEQMIPLEVAENEKDSLSKLAKARDLLSLALANGRIYAAKDLAMTFQFERDLMLSQQRSDGKDTTVKDTAAYDRQAEKYFLLFNDLLPEPLQYEKQKNVELSQEERDSLLSEAKQEVTKLQYQHNIPQDVFDRFPYAALEDIGICN